MATEVKLNSEDTSDVERFNAELARKRATFGRITNRVGREVIVNLATFENMRNNGTLPKKKDGVNFVDFDPLSEEELAEITEKNQNGSNGKVVKESKPEDPIANLKNKAQILEYLGIDAESDEAKKDDGKPKTNAQLLEMARAKADSE